MAYAFVRRPDGSVMCRLDTQEKAVVAQVAQEVAELIRVDLGWDDEPEAVRRAAQSDDPLERLEAEYASTPRSPQDSAVRRLLPDGSDDPGLADELRRMGQRDLVDAKLADLREVMRSIDAIGPISSEIVLAPPQAQAWLTALTDMRLVLADRLSLRSDDDLETLRALQEAGLAELGATEDADAAQLRPSAMHEGAEVAGPDIVLAVYDLLTWLQESLVLAISRASDTQA